MIVILIYYHHKPIDLRVKGSSIETDKSNYVYITSYVFSKLPTLFNIIEV